MKDIEVPKQNNCTLAGMQKVMYTKNNQGKFITENYGSNVEEFATKTAVDEYELLKKESLNKIKNNISSPIEYFMYENRMDIPTLASMVEMFQFRVKRHLKMKNFQKLNDDILRRYAEVFSININQLKDFEYEKK